MPSGVDVGDIIALRVFRLFYVRRLQVLLDQLLRLGRNLRFERLWNLGGSRLRQGRPRHLEKFAHIFCLFISLEKGIALYPSQDLRVKNKWKSTGTEMRCGHFGGAVLRQEDGNQLTGRLYSGNLSGGVLPTRDRSRRRGLRWCKRSLLLEWISSPAYAYLLP